MKKRFSVVLIILISVIGLFFYHLASTRYQISSPMKDIEYKTSIIRDSHNIFFRLENLRPVVGEEELTEFIKSNNDNPQIYTPSEQNRENGVFRANLHMHTLCSDGRAPVKKRLDDAQEYAKNNIKDGYMYIAITDHNTILGAKEAVKILQKYPERYKNIKLILGMEIFTAFQSQYYDKPVEIHVLTWCINPYDKFLNKEFYKADLKDKWNRHGKDRDFNSVISMMSNYSIPGVAHPVRYTNRIGENKYLYIEEMLESYKKNSTKPLFAEGFYQVYPRYYQPDFIEHEIIPYSEYINNKLKEKGITRTGSTDSHSLTIFD